MHVGYGNLSDSAIIVSRLDVVAEDQDYAILQSEATLQPHEAAFFMFDLPTDRDYDVELCKLAGGSESAQEPFLPGIMRVEWLEPRCIRPLWRGKPGGAVRNLPLQRPANYSMPILPAAPPGEAEDHVGSHRCHIDLVVGTCSRQTSGVCFSGLFHLSRGRGHLGHMPTMGLSEVL